MGPEQCGMTVELAALPVTVTTFFCVSHYVAVSVVAVGLRGSCISSNSSSRSKRVLSVAHCSERWWCNAGELAKLGCYRTTWVENKYKSTTGWQHKQQHSQPPCHGFMLPRAP